MKKIILLSSIILASLVSNAASVVHTNCKVNLLATRQAEKGRLVGSLVCKGYDNNAKVVGIIAEDADVKSLLLAARSAKISISAVGIVQEHEETKRVLLNQVELAYAE